MPGMGVQGWAVLPSWDGAAGPGKAGLDLVVPGKAGMELLSQGRLVGGHDLLLEHSRPTELSSCMNWLWPQAKAIPPPLAPARWSQPRLRASRPLSALLFMYLSPKMGWASARLQQTLRSSPPALAGHRCWNQVHVLPLQPRHPPRLSLPALE